MKSKSNDFCCVPTKSTYAHFACMKPAVVRYEEWGFCKKHAPAYKPFYVYAVNYRSSELTKVLVIQAPNAQNTYLVVNAADSRRDGNRLWGGRWKRSVKEALEAPLIEAKNRVEYTFKDIHRAKQVHADAKKVLKELRAAYSKALKTPLQESKS